MKKLLLTSLLSLTLPMAAIAQESVVKALLTGDGSNCTLKETVTMSINFNNNKIDMAQVKTLFDGKIEEIKALSTQAGITKLNISSMNYSLYPQSGSYDQWSPEPPKVEFQFNGSLSMTFEPADKATTFLELLTQKRYQANLSYNAYKENCQN